MTWTQVYDPLHNWWLSTPVAGMAILVLFGLLALEARSRGIVPGSGGDAEREPASS